MIQLMYLCPFILTTSRSVRNSLPGQVSSFCYLRNIGDAIYFLCICGSKTPFTVSVEGPLTLHEVKRCMPINLQAFLTHTHTHTHTHTLTQCLQYQPLVDCCLKAIAQRWLSISVWNITVPCHSCFSSQSLNMQTIGEGKHPVLREFTIL